MARQTLKITLKRRVIKTSSAPETKICPKGNGSGRVKK